MFGRGKAVADGPQVERCESCGMAAGSRRPMVHEYDVMVVGGSAKVRCLRCFEAAADAGTLVRFG